MIIYKILHIDSGKFYIGRTIQKLERRVKQHKQQIKTKNIISSLLRKYPINQFHIEIINGIVGNNKTESFEMLIKLEQKYLDEHLNNDLCVNLSTSAKGLHYSDYKNRKKLVQTNQQKELFRKNYLKWWNSRSIEDDLSKKEKLRLAHEAKLVPIKMFDCKNNYINTYPSIRAIIKDFTHLHRAGISRVLNNKYKQHLGYVFVYDN